MTTTSSNPDSFYVNDCRQVQKNTQSIQTTTGQISRLVGTIESDQDMQHCRKKVDDAVRMASETQALLLRIQDHQQQAQNPGEKNNRKMMYQKLSENLAITARVLEDVVSRFTKEERKRIAASEEIHIPMDAADLAGGEQQQTLIKRNVSPSNPLDDEIQKDKTQALQRVDDDMRSLKKIYTDLAAAADDQQQSFDTLEQHMANAAADIERGREEVSMGKYSWDRRMKQKMIYVGGAGVALLFVVGVIAHS